MEQLKEKKILTKADIQRLRTYIEQKNPKMGKVEKANVLANAIHQVVDAHTTEFQDDDRESIRTKLITNMVATGKEAIDYHDVLETYLAVSPREQNNTLKLEDWLIRRGGWDGTKEQLQNYMVNREKMLDFEVQTEVYEEAFSGRDENPVMEKEGNPTGHTEQVKENRVPYKKKLPLGILYGSLICVVIVMGVMWGLREVSAAKVRAKEERERLLQLASQQEKMNSMRGRAWGVIIEHQGVDLEKLREYLKQKGSILCDEPYFSAILSVAKEFDLNPIILFAIAGHEQGFVPRTHPQALKIANNPFNVYYSWKKYNTDIEDASRIASRTIQNLLKDWQEDMDPFQWINRKYAEDEEWWKGVRKIYNELERKTKNE